MSIPKILPLLLSIMVISIGCGNKPEVDLSVDKTNVNAGDTVNVTVESANIVDLVVDFGDSTQVSLTQPVPSTKYFKHSYDSAGSYLIQAIGLTEKDAETDMEIIEVE